MSDDTKQINDEFYWSGDPRKISILKTCYHVQPFKSSKPKLMVMIGCEQQGVGGVVGAVIKEDFQDEFDVRIIFSRSADELKNVFETHAFDLVVFNLSTIRFPSESGNSLSSEHRKKSSLELLRHLRTSNKAPLIALSSWDDPQFEKQLTDADYTFKLPCDVDELREAISVCLLAKQLEDFDNSGDVGGSDIYVVAGEYGRTNCP